MVDYRRFLAKSEAVDLPYLGGAYVDAKERRLTLTGARPPRHGWYRFEVVGRNATMKAPCDPPALDALPRVRGWLRGDRLFRDGGVIEQVHLIPEEEPPAFSPISARRWPTGALIFEGLEFESEAEGAVREALGDRRSLADVKGVPAPLRSAFGLSLLERVARDENVRFVPQEVRMALGPIGDGGVPKAQEVLRALEAERALARREWAELEARRQRAALAEDVEAQRAILRQQQANQAVHDLGRRNRPAGTVEERAEAALDAAGARMETLRRLGRDQLEVVYRYGGERFISIVDAITLQVIDSGICLGHPPRDDLVTLESLMGVIQEAIDTGRLVILRWP
jgi:hypothetical protein